MLYAKEDEKQPVLLFYCRTCTFVEPASASAHCVYRNNLYNTVGETAGVTQDVGADPTVGLPEFCTCTLCGEEIVCFGCGQATCAGFVVPEDYEEDLMEDFSEENTSEGNELSDLHLDEDYDEPEESMEGVEADVEYGAEERAFTNAVQCS